MIRSYVICAAAALLHPAAAATNNVIRLEIPDSPPPGTQSLSGSFQGYSMEMASFPSMAGNLS